MDWAHQSQRYKNGSPSEMFKTKERNEEINGKPPKGCAPHCVFCHRSNTVINNDMAPLRAL